MGSTASHTRASTYHPNALEFVYSALRFTQEQLGPAFPNDRRWPAEEHIWQCSFAKGRSGGVAHSSKPRASQRVSILTPYDGLWKWIDKRNPDKTHRETRLPVIPSMDVR